MKSRNKTGLVIGRFQPFHNGHLYLFKESLKYCDQLVIGIGSTNASDSRNPYDVKHRREMINRVIFEESLTKKIKDIIELVDFPDDEIWLNETLSKIGDVDVCLGNNEWTNEIFRKVGIEVVEIPFYQRIDFEGTKIREQIRNNFDWKANVPNYLIDIISRQH